MNHKWKELGGKPVKGEIDRKVCENCRLEWRRIRRGSTKPHGGWIEVQYRRGKGVWQQHHGNKMIPCNHCRECPTCEGTGLITREKYLEMKHGS
jgi:hypothetical protein